MPAAMVMNAEALALMRKGPALLTGEKLMSCPFPVMGKFGPIQTPYYVAKQAGTHEKDPQPGNLVSEP